MQGNINLGAKVEGVNGNDMGVVKYLVADPRTKQVTHLVLEKGLFGARDVVVDCKYIQGTSDDGKSVQVNLTEEQVDKLPDFIERDYVNMGVNPSRTDGGVDTTIAGVKTSDYGGGGAAMAGTLFPVTGATMATTTGSASGTPVSPVVPFVTDPLGDVVDGPADMPYEEKMNVPKDSVLIKEGVVVEALDGKLGTVKQVNLDADGRINSFVVEKGLIFKQDVVVPMSCVDTATEKTVRLNVSKDQALNNFNASDYEDTNRARTVGDYVSGANSDMGGYNDVNQLDQDTYRAKTPPANEYNEANTRDLNDADPNPLNRGSGYNPDDPNSDSYYDTGQRTGDTYQTEGLKGSGIDYSHAEDADPPGYDRGGPATDLPQDQSGQGREPFWMNEEDRRVEADNNEKLRRMQAYAAGTFDGPVDRPEEYPTSEAYESRRSVMGEKGFTEGNTADESLAGKMGLIDDNDRLRDSGQYPGSVPHDDTYFRDPGEGPRDDEIRDAK